MHMYHRLYKGPEYLRFAHRAETPRVGGGRQPRDRENERSRPGAGTGRQSGSPSIKKKTTKKHKKEKHAQNTSHALFFCRFFSVFLERPIGLPHDDLLDLRRKQVTGGLGNGRGRSLRNASRMLVYRHFPSDSSVATTVDYMRLHDLV